MRERVRVRSPHEPWSTAQPSASRQAAPGKAARRGRPLAASVRAHTSWRLSLCNAGSAHRAETSGIREALLKHTRVVRRLYVRKRTEGCREVTHTRAGN